MHLKPSLLAIILTCLFLQPFESVVNAAELTIDEIINIAGRQRMLTQRIAKSYLLIGQGVATDKFNQQLQAGQQLFEKQLVQLASFLKNQQQDVLLVPMQGQWSTFSQLVTQKPQFNQADNVIKEGDRLLAACEQLVIVLEQQVKGKKGRLINLAGRQRMLSQRIAMLYAGLSWRVTGGDLQQHLQAAVDEYDRALVMLRSSSVNNEALNSALDKVISQWRFSRSGFNFMKNNQYVPFVIAATTEFMLKKMEGITSQYEAIH
ncbi:type IV pili methyl-accepting chemotaxis transducer N-terminal domain-containing protein [Endozoicomonas sp. SM1973]|uniref:Type IV pili methyl-accepting chemotaxis transducer N-terminal domain-containing protein n=1 Tax=Spartinivicinus marinus TaxID=2994442 RepID=A0A853HZ88_9GAMM|nr:type IV pili methyl-accepting chemotaxis transducer N-terminal domain-containing protein [Spartinivicinus marinus]MCX4024851.1 type IV pili methyl-accepting chemotaxis transducer N-terminal domain-containing protein [Spartinivicinus marinus]NYZ66503.1 type IV pili methyl-accepting chemotaxis transducer N-terminal domain-containing protein [Spartinivicinus marinus]